MFGEAIDCEAVTVRRQRWWWLQPRHITMAPDGHIWCHPDGEVWCQCFAARGAAMQALFLHEMTHVWQHQSGICLPLRRPPFARYRYRLVPGRPFERYGIEQQATMVQDAFLARVRGRPEPALEAVLPFRPTPPGAAQGAATSTSSLPKLPPE